jgi:hypothetical protein
MIKQLAEGADMAFEDQPMEFIARSNPPRHSHQAFGVTAVAVHPQETMLKTAVFEVILEIPARRRRYHRAGGGMAYSLAS